MLRMRGRPALAAARWTSLRFALCCAGVAALSLWIRSGVPACALADAGEDDALFVRLAQSLATGHWLGPFDDKTLVKGMAYPAFIAASFWAGVPLKIAEQAVYLAACLLVALLLRRAAPRGSWMPLAVFTVLALDPVLWTAEFARIIREGLYIGLTLALLAASAWASLAPGRRWASALGVGAFLGITGAAFWLTREEGVWLVPALIANVGLGGLAAWRRRDGRTALRAGAAWATAILVCSSALLGVATINRARYGAFETNEVQSAPFVHAYGALARIRQASPRRYVVLSGDARAAAYAVSPAARELAPVLDGPLGDARRRAGCAEAEVADCPEILAGWFQWALRDAAASAGHYGSAAASAAYYDRLAREIDAGCDSGALSCRPRHDALAPPLHWDDIALAAHTFPRLAEVLASLGRDTIGALPSVGSPAALAAMADMVGPVAPPAVPPTAVRGWAGAEAAPPSLRASPEDAPAAVAVRPAPDVSLSEPAVRAVRFSLETAGAAEGQGLVVTIPGEQGGALSLDALQTDATLAVGAATVHIDERTVSSAVGQRRRDAMMAVARGIADLYAAVLPAASALACLGFTAACLRRRGSAIPPLALALATSSAIAVLCRLALLSVLDATAIPAVNNLYPSPAAPPLLLFASLGCWLGIAAFSSPTARPDP